MGARRPRWSGDENGDWRQEKDDVGLDGLPGTGDEGEGNGKPDVGIVNGDVTAEPRFGIRDVNESDQIGLTSFWALPYGGSNLPINDELFWEKLSSDSIDINQELFGQEGDNIFLYGSGPFRLEPGGTQRFSIALMMGENLDDLVLNSETAQRILESNYQFAQPPPKPIVRAVPGDKRVTLYWDNAAESTVDPQDKPCAGVKLCSSNHGCKGVKVGVYVRGDYVHRLIRACVTEMLWRRACS